MNWKDFVETVNRKLREEGKTDETEIIYIDTHMPQSKDKIDIEIDNDGIRITDHP